MPKIAAVIVAAGQGQRAGGGLPKQFRPLVGIPVLRRSVEAFAALPEIGTIVVVAAAERRPDCERVLACLPRLAYATGGVARQDSVRNGLAALESHAPDFVLVHDAARPLVSQALIRRVIAALISGAVAAVPLLAVTDTLKRKEQGAWTTVSREGLYRAQTPQGFRFESLLEAHWGWTGAEATDDMAIAERTGLAITRIDGEDTNLKITTEEDLVHAAKLLGETMSEFRTGLGFDAHRFTTGDHVWLCGVRIAHDAGLEGHSDADAGLHALTDAILGAIGAGDIGRHFPPTEERWRGAPSSHFLAHAADLVRQPNGAVVHCDVTLVCEKPKIAPHREAMRARIAEILAIDISRVSVKATTTEGMGFVGRGEGLAAQAVATVRLPAA
ncbi:MAG TPA: bifunctional 2-C-methyl-D-erythritol 4-phosphate cytidylyltransferase/2-C-methyl-D-erythritol 2,4-cyclodiphosphate synthase [Rhizomicrobium sp.]|jgi:2-C-methyl-D-erythritol 4-phosphate cytidylyltransferase/2-C-methyl-D-erythritol 2,4-cyclodiphosphate synthase